MAGDNKVYRKTEIVGTSDTGIEDAVSHALERAQQTLRNVQWFEITEQRGRINNGKIEFQVSLQVGFELEEST